MPVWGRPRACLPIHRLVLAVWLAAWGWAPAAAWGMDLHPRLATGEIIVSCPEMSEAAAKQVEVMGMVDASPEKVWEVITDINYFQNFMPRTLKSRAVTPETLQAILKIKPTEAPIAEALLDPVPPHPALYRVPGQKYDVYLYSLLDFPFPLCNRWYILKITNDETQAGGHIYTSSWTMEIGNLRENRGEWRLIPFADGQTQVTYRLFTDPGGCLPDFLVKQGTKATLPQIILAVRKRVAQLSPSQTADSSQGGNR